MPVIGTTAKCMICLSAFHLIQLSHCHDVITIKKIIIEAALRARAAIIIFTNFFFSIRRRNVSYIISVYYTTATLCRDLQEVRAACPLQEQQGRQKWKLWRMPTTATTQVIACGVNLAEARWPLLVVFAAKHMVLVVF